MRVELGRPGIYKTTSGMAIELSTDDLRACASSYRTDLHEAPLCIGEPKEADPAWGWVKAVRFERGVLFADCDQVAPVLEAGVRSGTYTGPRRCFYPPEARTNPSKGCWYLRQVTFDGPLPSLQFDEYPGPIGVPSAMTAHEIAGMIVAFQEAQAAAGRHVTTTQAAAQVRALGSRAHSKRRQVRFDDPGTESLTLTQRFVGARLPGAGLGTIEDTVAFAEASIAFQDAEAMAGRRWASSDATNHLFRIWGGKRRDRLPE